MDFMVDFITAVAWPEGRRFANQAFNFLIIRWEPLKTAWSFQLLLKPLAGLLMSQAPNMSLLFLCFRL